MAKNLYSLGISTLSASALCGLFRGAMALFPRCPADIELLFGVAINDRTLFPDINIAGVPTEQQYLIRWIKGYEDASAAPPSRRISVPKGTCSDPAICTIVQAAGDLTPGEVLAQERCHSLFMSAENVQGSLLEEYIAGAVRPYGWIWCRGKVLHAVDFCNTDGSKLLQVKNKSNTENSSSSAIRAGTGIEKWYRLGTRTVSGRKMPYFLWDALNSTINAFKTEGCSLPPCHMTEESYRDFLLDVTAKNKAIISSL